MTCDPTLPLNDRISTIRSQPTEQITNVLELIQNQIIGYLIDNM